MTTQDLGPVAGGKRRIRFTAFDPSAASLGGTYMCTLREELSKTEVQLVGNQIIFDLDQQDLHKLTLARDRSTVVRSVNFMGNWKHFVKNGGQQFVRVLPTTPVPGGAPALVARGSGNSETAIRLQTVQLKDDGDAAVEKGKTVTSGKRLRLGEDRNQQSCGNGPLNRTVMVEETDS